MSRRYNWPADNASRRAYFDFAPPLAAASRLREKIMHQRWEHLLLSAFWSSDTGWTMRLGPDTRLEDWGQITTFVDQLGDQGWELVSTTSLNYPSGSIEYAMAFKRPKIRVGDTGPNGPEL
jgi:hypothetical protein